MSECIICKDTLKEIPISCLGRLFCCLCKETLHEDIKTAPCCKKNYHNSCLATYFAHKYPNFKLSKTVQYGCPHCQRITTFPSLETNIESKDDYFDRKSSTLTFACIILMIVILGLFSFGVFGRAGMTFANSNKNTVLDRCNVFHTHNKTGLIMSK